MGGMGGKGGSAPTAPDFTKAATATQTNPFGTTSQWNQGPNGQYSQTQSFGGPLGGAAQGMESQLANAWGSPLDNGQQARQGAQDAIYSQATSRLDPQWAQREHDFTTGLANQGIDPNSQAYSTAMGNFGRQRNDAYQQANYGSIMGGGQEAQRQQQMDINSRMAPLGALGGMGGLTGQSQNPLLPAAMAQYQGALQNYGIDQQGKNSMFSGLTGLGGTLGAAKILAPAALSDGRRKTDFVETGRRDRSGLPLVRFRYRDDHARRLHEGVIAQDVEASGRAHWITEVDGVKHVPSFLAPVPVDEDG